MFGSRWPVLALLVAPILLVWPAGSSALAEYAPPFASLAQPAAVPGAQVDPAVLANGLRALNGFAALSQVALTQNDLVAARAAWSQFDQGWEAIEDGVRDRSRNDYRSIEDAMSDVDRILRNDPVDVAVASMLLGELQTRVERFIATLPTS
jgi:hypothetical protein